MDYNFGKSWLIDAVRKTAWAGPLESLLFGAKMSFSNGRPPFSASDVSKSINNEGRLIIYYDEDDREIKRMQKGRGRLPLGAFLDPLGNYVVKVILYGSIKCF